MNKKPFTYLEVKKIFSDRGYTLLSEEYIDRKQDLWFICPNGHKYFIKLKSFLRGHNCLLCSPKCRKDIDFIRNEFLKKGYTLLENTYINGTQKLKTICNNGHVIYITWEHFSQGHFCMKCSGKKKKTIEEIQKSLEKEGYTLLSNKYIDCEHKFDYICPNNHKSSISWHSWNNGGRCFYCYHFSKTKYIYFDENIHSFYEYRRIVTRLSEAIYKKYKYLINPLDLSRGHGKYHLDHKYTVYDGYINKINPEIIANLFNLKMMLGSDNISKSGKSDITIKELMIGWDMYNLYEEILY